MVKFKEYFRNTDILPIMYSIYEWQRSYARRISYFNALLDKGSQIIISADRNQQIISYSRKIKSRFSRNRRYSKIGLRVRRKIVEHK